MSSIKRVFKHRELTSLAFVIGLFLLVGAINNSFLTLQNIMLCLNGSVVYTLVAVGVAFVIISGEIDVSVGATLGLTATISASMLRDGAPWAAAFLAALVVGAAIGAFNGLGVVVLRIPSIIMTLGVNSVVRGMCYVYTSGKWVENLPFEFKQLSQATTLGGVTWFYLCAVALTVLIHILMKRTRRGKYFSAVGDNAGGATLIGIPVKGTVYTGFIICGLLSATAGLLYASRTGLVTPMAGNGYEMKAIAACVLGGVSLSGGIGSVLGAAIGSIIMASIGRILVFMQFSSDYDNTITGILLICIVVMDALLLRRSREQARRQRLAARVAVEEGGAGHAG